MTSGSGSVVVQERVSTHELVFRDGRRLVQHLITLVTVDPFAAVIGYGRPIGRHVRWKLDDEWITDEEADVLRNEWGAESGLWERAAERSVADRVAEASENAGLGLMAWQRDVIGRLFGDDEGRGW